MARTIAVANQKGGVAKTTTVQALGSAWAAIGDRVLLVDLDPQACLTYAVGIDPDTLERSLHDCFVRSVPAADVLVTVGDMALLPSSIDLAGSEVQLMSRTGREHGLRMVLDPVLDDFDVVLVDCPPSLGVLTLNGLTAANEVIIPMQCEALSRRGVGQLLETIDDVRELTNPGLRVAGVVATMLDRRTNEGKRVLEEIAAERDLALLDPPIPRSIRFAEAPASGRSILESSPTHQGADAYRTLAENLRGALR